MFPSPSNPDPLQEWYKGNVTNSMVLWFPTNAMATTTCDFPFIYKSASVGICIYHFILSYQNHRSIFPISLTTYNKFINLEVLHLKHECSFKKTHGYACLPSIYGLLRNLYLAKNPTMIPYKV